MAQRRPTLATVAERVGVTAMTVSNAYNRPDKLSAALRVRILDAARELGYAGPHPVARSLRHGRTGSVGVLLGETLSYGFDDPSAVAFLGGVADECTAAGHNLLLLATGSEDASVVRDAAVDGFVLWSIPRGHPLLPAVLERGLPLVIHGGPQVPGVRHVHIDNRPAAAEVARHAVTGDRWPAVISFKQRRPQRDRLRVGIPSHGVAYPVTADRLAGYADGIAAAGIDPSRIPVFEVSANDRVHGRAAAAALLDQRPRPTVILAMSDELALGALAELSDRGLAVPADVALTGWDDTAGSRTAGLTTVRQSLRDQGAACARLLLAPDTEVPAPTWELVVRESTA